MELDGRTQPREKATTRAARCLERTCHGCGNLTALDREPPVDRELN
jgi:hypothetical protein